MAGADCVKFQSWSADSLYSKSFYDENPIAKRIFNKFDWIKEANVSKEIERFISQEQPDIICFQEYSKSSFNGIK